MQQTPPNLLQLLPRDPRYKLQRPGGVQMPNSPLVTQAPNVSSGLVFFGIATGVLTPSFVCLPVGELTMIRA